MGTLESLIKLNKFSVDEIRIELGKLQLAAEEIVRTQEKLLAERQRESENATKLQKAGDPIAADFAAYNARITAKHTQLGKDAALLENQISIVRDKLQDAFAELKKYEITLKERKKALEKKRAAREIETYNETAITRHHRDQKDG